LRRPAWLAARALLLTRDEMSYSLVRYEFE
jgi:hypothetical protein